MSTAIHHRAEGRSSLARRVCTRGAAICVCLVILLCAAGTASAHIIVLPARSAPGAAEQYTVTVPAERGVPTVRVRIEIPAGVVVYQYDDPPGWNRELDTAPDGHVTAITWSGNAILPTEYATFSFMATNPKTGTALVWKASQTYQDGLVVRWDGPPSSQQPAAITSLTLQTASTAGSSNGTGGSDHTLAETGLAIALLALAVSLFGNGLLILSLRKRVLTDAPEG